MASKEFEFYVKANLKEYEGKYVAIVGDKVVASGDNAKEAFEEAKRKTGKTPTIAKIPKEEALILKSLRSAKPSKHIKVLPTLHIANTSGF